jgi:hypothetical protein
MLAKKVSEGKRNFIQFILPANDNERIIIINSFFLAEILTEPWLGSSRI